VTTEEDVGRTVRNSDIPRDEVFIRAKFWNDDHAYDSVLSAFDTSLSA